MSTANLTKPVQPQTTRGKNTFYLCNTTTRLRTHLDVVVLTGIIRLDLQVREGSVDLVAPRRLDDPRAVAVVRIVVGEVGRLDRARVLLQSVVAICERKGYDCS